MTDTSSKLALICALSLGQFACSAGGSTGGSSSTGGGTSHGGSGSSSQAGSTSQAGGAGPAAGSSNGGAGTGGANSSGASGSGSAAAGASAGDGTTGSSGSTSSAGSGGVAACTPGTGTQPVGDKSELDQKTCLTWTTNPTTTTLTNKQAAKYCDDLVQDGISDWRVPHPEELVTWPGLTTDSTAYITGPTYIPNNAASVMDGCTGDSHSCNIAKYNDTSVTCGWQGVGFAGWVVCVSGTATPGTTDAAYSAANCSPCNSELPSFTETDCLPYAN